MATLLVIAGLSSLIHAQGFVPLVDKRFTYPDGIPYKVDTDVGLPRGEQLGYNICNSTTEGPKSLCQTAFINSLDDFCFWAPGEPGHTVGDIEGEMIAWCTQPGHGTRVIPDGTITGVQFTKTPDYVQVVGFMDQTKINMVAGDAGGEMDPHGADLRGNPMGGILFSRAFTGSFLQVVEWHNFMGSNQFCLKACDPRGRDDAKFCEHIFDTQGCGFNAPSNARDGVFESCAGDNQAFPGAPPVVPSSSLCSTFASTAIFGGGTQVPLPVVTIPPQGVATTPAPIPTTTATTTRSTSSTSSSGTSHGGPQSSNSVGPSVDTTVTTDPSRPTTSSPTDTAGSQSPPGPSQTSDASMLKPSALIVAPIAAIFYMFL